MHATSTLLLATSFLVGSSALRTATLPGARAALLQPHRALPRLVADVSVDTETEALDDEDELVCRLDADVMHCEAVTGVIVPTEAYEYAAAPPEPSVSEKRRRGALLFAFAGVAAGLTWTAPAGRATLGAIAAQVTYELAHCTASPAKLFGFCGACCNWFLGLSAIYDAKRNGPEVISLPMTLVMLVYSIIFSRWAGWDVMPRNFILAGSHMLNIGAQSNQLRRCLAYKLNTQPDAQKEIKALGVRAAGALAAIGAFVLSAPALKAMMPAGSFLASNGGPFTIHPWPPVTKLFLSLTSLADLQRPVEKISLTQYAALTLTGFIFSFYGMFVTPINYALTAVNILLFGSSGWHLSRKLNACMTRGECAVE